MQNTYSAFFREERTFYTLKEAVQNFGLNPDSVEDRKTVSGILKELIGNQIVVYGKPKQARTDDLNDEDDSDVEIISELIDSDDEKEDKTKGYVFKFVGICSVKNFIFYIYPKYIVCKNEDGKSNSMKFIRPLVVNPESPTEEESKNIEEYERTKNKLDEHFKSVMKVINYFAKDKFIQPLTFFNNPERETDPVSFMVFMLQQYYEHGLYYKEETVIETNGDGEIDWDRTINETIPIIQNNIPFYVELKTIQKQEASVNIIRNLHMAILSECSQKLKDMGIMDYIGISPVYFDWRKVTDVGSEEYLKKVMRSELQVQNANIQKVQLYNMLHYLGEEDKAASSKIINVYGTRTFENIWEKVLKADFDDLYNNDRHYEHKRLGGTKNPKFKDLLNLIENLSGNDYLSNNEDLKVSEILGKTQWKKIKDGEMAFNPTKGLIPDVVSFYDNKIFLLDAKDYLIEENGKSICRQPPAPDVSKQFIYEAVIRKKIPNTDVLNYFIIPQPMDFSEDSNDSKKDFLYEYVADYEDIRVLFNDNPKKKIKCISLNPDIAYSLFLQRVSLLKEFSEFSNALEGTDSEPKAPPAYILMCECKNEEEYTYDFSYDNLPNGNLYLCHYVLFVDEDKPSFYAHIKSFNVTNDEEKKISHLTLEIEKEQKQDIPDFLKGKDLNKLAKNSPGNMYSNSDAPQVLDLSVLRENPEFYNLSPC